VVTLASSPVTSSLVAPMELAFDSTFSCASWAPLGGDLLEVVHLVEIEIVGRHARAIKLPFTDARGLLKERAAREHDRERSPGDSVSRQECPPLTSHRSRASP
jgi:hypothetical protein